MEVICQLLSFHMHAQWFVDFSQKDMFAAKRMQALCWCRIHQILALGSCVDVVP